MSKRNVHLIKARFLCIDPESSSSYLKKKYYILCGNPGSLDFPKDVSDRLEELAACIDMWNIFILFKPPRIQIPQAPKIK
jgi:hypothetical protein